jgi:hypothetical protein
VPASHVILAHFSYLGDIPWPTLPLVLVRSSSLPNPCINALENLWNQTKCFRSRSISDKGCQINSNLGITPPNGDSPLLQPLSKFRAIYV